MRIMKYRAISENHLYLKAYRKGKKVVGRNIIVYVLKDYLSEKLRLENPQKKNINRVGLTVTKKNGKAVVRNRIKRIIREAYRQTDTEYNIKKGYLIVIVAKMTAADKKTGDIKKDLIYAMKKLSMIDVSSDK